MGGTTPETTAAAAVAGASDETVAAVADDDPATTNTESGSVPASEAVAAEVSDVAPEESAAEAVAAEVAAVAAEEAAAELATEVADAPPAEEAVEASIEEVEVVAATPPADRPEPTTMDELLAEQDADIRSFKHGDVVEGTVVRIDRDEILVDIGAKSEGVVSNRELYGRHAETQPALDVGDVVLVYVLQPESQEGHAVLSLRRAGLERKWRAMQEQL